jgi:glyoxylase-like metal-dependent hydrolase (beta-lactamase superfamily II)
MAAPGRFLQTFPRGLPDKGDAMNRMILLVALAFSAQFVTAQEDPMGPLVDKVVAAYGGDALAGLRNYEIVDSYTAANLGQSWSPDLTSIGSNSFRFINDLENNRAYSENYFRGRGGIFPNLVIVNGEDAWNVNLQTMRYGEAASGDPYTFGGGVMRTTDTLLARELDKARKTAEYLGETEWMNRTHAMVKMPFPQSPELTLYIDSESGLITRMSRDNPALGRLDYLYEKHEPIDGLVAATRVNFVVAGSPNLIGAGREIRFNRALSPVTFQLPAGVEPEAERIDQTQLIVNRLADNVYHIGQNGGYSIFVDTGKEVIGCGGYPGLAQRLDTFREKTGSHRPLRYQVVTHHHQDHLGGIDEALDLGATLVTVPDAIPEIRKYSAQAPENGRFLTVNGRMTLGEGSGRVEIYDVSTIHSFSNLLFYVPSTRTLFLADHFGGPYAEGVPVANANTASMAEALEPLDLNYSRIVTAHNARVYSARDFTRSVERFRDFDCPDDRPLCSRDLDVAQASTPPATGD